MEEEEQEEKGESENGARVGKERKGERWGFYGEVEAIRSEEKRVRMRGRKEGTIMKRLKGDGMREKLKKVQNKEKQKGRNMRREKQRDKEKYEERKE